MVIDGDMQMKMRRLLKQCHLDAILRKGNRHFSSFVTSSTISTILIFTRVVTDYETTKWMGTYMKLIV